MDYYLYELTDSPDQLYRLQAHNIKDKILNHSNKFQDDVPNGQNLLVSLFENSINIQVTDDLDYYFKVDRDKLIRYYTSRFHFAQTIFDHMDIDGFIKLNKTPKLADLIHRSVDHYIYYQHKFMTLDTFLRTCEWDQVYYVGNAIKII